ncbi:MAG: RNA polymerase sigma factor [Parvibaculum sp.]|uniref:RNA polymerase sigma factor n=1 Tax=Parvibaculum sp. TaxID=2024848 RepID=UPI003C72E6C7
MTAMNLEEQKSPLPSPSLVDLDDASLVAALRHGDKRAFELIMRRYNQRLFRVARSILRNETEAEDAVQESWLRAFTHLERLQDPARLGSWLARIAANEALDRLRRRGPPVPQNFDEANERESAPGANPPFPTPDAEKRRSEARALIERAVDGLPENFRIVFVLRSIEELSVEETARVLDIPADTVKTRLHRANKLLREELKDALDAALPDAFGFDGARCDRIVANVLSRLQTASGRLPQLPPD